MHFTSSTTGGLSGSQGSSQSSNYTREAMDPIAGQCDSTHTHSHTSFDSWGVFQRSAVFTSRVVVAIPCLFHARFNPVQCLAFAVSAPAVP